MWRREIFCTIDSGAEFVVVLPPKERMAFQHVLYREFEELIKYVSAVDAEASEAFDEADRAEIHRIIRNECEGGFKGVNSKICTGMRNWLAQAVRTYAINNRH